MATKWNYYTALLFTIRGRVERKRLELGRADRKRRGYTGEKVDAIGRGHGERRCAVYWGIGTRVGTRVWCGIIVAWAAREEMGVRAWALVAMRSVGGVRRRVW